MQPASSEANFAVKVSFRACQNSLIVHIVLGQYHSTHLNEFSSIPCSTCRNSHSFCSLWVFRRGGVDVDEENFDYEGGCVDVDEENFSYERGEC